MTGELNMDHSCFDSKMKRPNGMVADLEGLERQKTTLLLKFHPAMDYTIIFYSVLLS